MAGPDALPPDAVVVAAEGQLGAAVEDERVLLDRDADRYYGLNPVGARIWELVQQPARLDELREAITAEFDVDAETCERDLRAFLADLADAGLVEVADDAAPEG